MSHISQMGYQAAKAQRDELERAMQVAADALKVFPKTGAMNLTPDSVKASPEYQTAKRTFDASFMALKRFNAIYVKEYAAQIRADRHHH